MASVCNVVVRFRGDGVGGDRWKPPALRVVKIDPSAALCTVDVAHATLNHARHRPLTCPSKQRIANAGHGTHTAATAAGSTLTTPAETVTCDPSRSQVLGCGGGCITPTGSSSNSSDASDNDSDEVSINRLCPMFGCEGAATEEQCLGDDVSETLSDHGGMAQGAKIAVMDIFFKDYSYGDLAGNGLWEACLSAGCRIHSNSYGVDKRCELSSMDLAYDDFMYNVRERKRGVEAEGRGGERRVWREKEFLGTLETRCFHLASAAGKRSSRRTCKFLGF